MPDMTKYSYDLGWFVLPAVLLGVLPGCADRRRPTDPLSPYPEHTTVAIAPLLNYSGAESLNTLTATDLFYSELQQVKGLTVIPVNRVLAQMAQNRWNELASPQDVLKLADQLGAQIILVAAVTEYNPYYPPIVGLAVQLFSAEATGTGSSTGIDPTELQRSARPLPIEINLERKYWPKNQIQRIYNARSEEIVSEVKAFAKQRGATSSPYGWEFYLRSQQDYLRFVFHQAICELLTKEAARVGRGPGTEAPEK